MKTLIATFLLLATLPLAAQLVPFEDTPPVKPTEGPLTPDVSLDAAPGGTPPAAGTAPAAEPTPAALDDEVLKALQKLSPEKRQKYALLISEASKLVQGIRIQEALERIFEAEAIYADYHGLQNLKGAAYTKVRDFEKATQCFKRTLELNPNSMEAKFNLAEMSFVEKQYEQALADFNQLLKDNPRFPAQTRNLLLYKIYLSTLLLDRDAEAEKMLAGFNYMSDTPEYYYANAAKQFHAKDDEGAREWLKSASRIYDKGLQDLFIDSLVEVGWIQTL